MKTQRTLLNLVFILLPICSSLCIDMYLPAYINIAKNFSISVNAVNFTMSIYLFGLAFGQLLYGFLSDHLGRKNLLIPGLLIFIISNFLTIYANDFPQFLLARLFQALGACSTIVLTTAIVSDLYLGRERSKILSLIAAANIISPTIAPSLGGILISYYNWYSIFEFISFFGLVMLLLVIFLIPETKTQSNKASVDLKSLNKNLIRLFSNRSFIGSLIGLSFLFSGIFAWVTYSPAVIIEILHIRQIFFGVYFLFPAVSITLGYLIVFFLTGKFKDSHIIYTGYGLILCSTATLFFITFFFYSISIYAILIPVSIVFLGIGLVQSLQLSFAIGLFRNISGLAAGIIGLFQTAMGASISIITGLIPGDSIHYLTLLFCIIFSVAFLAFIFANFPTVQASN